MSRPFTSLQSWLSTRQAMRLDRSELKARQSKLWKNMQATIQNTPALSNYLGQNFEDFPVTSPAHIRNNFTDWNSVGISNTATHAAAQNAEDGANAEVSSGIIAGYSSGTSGARGLFLASAKERAIYRGQSMAKLLPLNSIYKGVRIMLFLRANSKLYSTGKRSGPFQFMYCPLSMPLEEKQRKIEAFQPTVLIAPSHVLGELAAASVHMPFIKKCYYGSEPMGDGEREGVTAALGIRPDPIYQATEGFLGASCKHGRLHLNEDALIFEFAPVDGTDGHQPIVTDLFRRSQPIIRVKLDDYIELDSSPCPCGFAGQTIKPIAGRVQNLWRLQDKIITPEAVTNCLERSLGAQTHWIAEASPSSINLHLKNTVSNGLAQHAMQHLTENLKLDCPVHIKPFKIQNGTKRQRVLWRDDA